MRSRRSGPVVGVIDLKAGRAVHALGGRRDEYQPVPVVAGEVIDGDAEALARAYVERLGVEEIYIADLDAIAAAGAGDRASSAPSASAALVEEHHAVVHRISRQAPVWLDSAISSPDAARHAIARGAARVVVGLETLDSLMSLAAIAAAVGADRVVFSADLIDGQPLARRWTGMSPSLDGIVAEAARLGIGALIVLDLARVGRLEGPDLDLLRRVRAAIGACPLFAGGGVRDENDLRQLEDAGCDGALVATALHLGTLTGEARLRSPISRASGGRSPTDQSSLPLPFRQR